MPFALNEHGQRCLVYFYSSWLSFQSLLVRPVTRRDRRLLCELSTRLSACSFGWAAECFRCFNGAGKTRERKWLFLQESLTYVPHQDAQQRVRQHMRQKRRSLHLHVCMCRSVKSGPCYGLDAKPCDCCLSTTTGRPRKRKRSAQWKRRTAWRDDC